MSVIIRSRTENDMPAVLRLIQELALFENAPDEVTVTVDELIQGGFRDNHFFVKIAEQNSEIIGMALCYTGYSTWKGKMLYLDDLIVKEQYRNRGIGKMLLDTIIQSAYEMKARVIKWQVLNWNKKAINFYKPYKVTFDNEWMDCKMFEKEISWTVNEQVGK